MKKFGYIELIVSGKKGIFEINPDNYDVRDIISDIQNVENLLFPVDKTKRPTLAYRIEEGSIKHLFKTSAQFVIGFTAILNQILSANNIDFLDVNTARAFESFQESAIKKDLTFNVTTSMTDSPTLKIDKSTRFYRTEPTWVNAEFYFYGKVVDAGGKDKVNIHLDTPELGTIIIKTPQDTLAKLEKNILYKSYGVRAIGKQDSKSGEIDKKSLEFRELIDYVSLFEEEYLKKLRKKAMSWLKNIDPDDWLGEIRGRDYAK